MRVRKKLISAMESSGVQLVVAKAADGYRGVSE